MQYLIDKESNKNNVICTVIHLIQPQTYNRFVKQQRIKTEILKLHEVIILLVKKINIHMINLLYIV
jgi:hypothetical protein